MTRYILSKNSERNVDNVVRVEGIGYGSIKTPKV